jgi:hypothetical protein
MTEATMPRKAKSDSEGLAPNIPPVVVQTYQT